MTVPPEVAVAVIGAGSRCQNLYGPLLTMLPGLRLAGVSGRRRDCTIAVAERLQTSAYPTVDDLLADPTVDAMVVCVRWSENPEVYRQLAGCDQPMLLETPLSANPAEAGQVASLLSTRGAYTDVAEQYHRRPVELLKRELIDRGMFGSVLYAYTDGVGHEYHGISLLRSYLGWPARPRRVLALQRDLPLADHVTHRNVFVDSERIQHALVEFDNDTTAAYHWSWLNYESPIRVRRQAGFTGTHGAAWGEELVGLSDPEHLQATCYRMERRSRVVDGIEVLAEIAAMTGDSCIAKWYNPYPALLLDEDRVTAAEFLANLGRAVREPGTEPLYPIRQAAADHATVDAMYQAIAAETGSWSMRSSQRGTP
jgi:predicted dehydrogenase